MADFTNALQSMFQGMEQGNKDDLARQDLQRSFLANQREQQMLPLDIQTKQAQLSPLQYQAKLSQAQMQDPSYINSVMQGVKDQNARIGFDMQKQRDTLQNEIGATNAKNTLATTQDTLFNNFRQAQQSGDQVKAKSLLGMLVQDPKFQQVLQEQAAKDQAALTRQGAGDAAAMERLKLQLANQKEIASMKPEKSPSLEESIVKDIQGRLERGEITPDIARQMLQDAWNAKVRVDPNPPMGLSQTPDGRIVFGAGDVKPKLNLNPQIPPQPQQAPQAQSSIDLKLQDPTYRAKAIEWVKANPNDPKAKLWAQKLGL